MGNAHITASLGEETAFLCEVQQGGIFSIAGIEGTQMAHCLGAYCPNILFPYARECITSMVSRGTFPQLNLAPVNFDALFMNYLQQQDTPNGLAQFFTCDWVAPIDKLTDEYPMVLSTVREVGHYSCRSMTYLF